MKGVEGRGMETAREDTGQAEGELGTAGRRGKLGRRKSRVRIGARYRQTHDGNGSVLTFRAAPKRDANGAKGALARRPMTKPERAKAKKSTAHDSTSAREPFCFLADGTVQGAGIG